MTESVLTGRITTTSDRPKVQKWMRFLVWKIAIATLLLMAVGSATRVMNAGLACPDWPLCYGQLVPTQQMNLQVFLEWFHRLDASLIGLSTLALVGLSWWFRKELPKWLPWACLGALGLIVFQGILGGLTVTQMLRFDIVTAHLGTALLFFASLVIIALCLTPYQGTTTAGTLRWVSLTAAILVYVQCLLGALVGSRWALHQCFGGSQLCAVMNSHIIGVVPATLATLAVVATAWRTPALHPTLRKLAWVAGGIVVLQVLLGVATFYLHLQVEPLTVTHHTVGAALFATLVALTTLGMRDAKA
ncbi:MULTISPECIES: COX15/CtaA family protein [Crocosphaera]|uniref:Heme A synthase, cytochrome oxidase biogenesis protein Cox15-CtaA n=6 Tax=Crocosphaera TaxID=263510 RepID=T2JPZ4_CROWT|nr:MULTISPECIES: heme A synthase [Crocosphaera]EHJ15177.1 Heme A synthase, cytochrome oxidase biogenesis protein Cox15-CtaA [Crocosphaera watsonii WH 0003]MCH2244676.1 heme A synthase [Crocosphaera sp.]CCQ50188.1 Heme A synthase, cytochrome oxidase biogenesis protein Cox15-CtaA [Crocosphaera watsonii WH 8502]CCQ56907.1 Heme A synthase, cytochrome oxidase biogenesis protein Cox15-CtaA [Crocosphaera watsonii WH 0005]CCQ60853.1 Heme A synthase, cytochrome oxidase biogenesis protein Cox15-CtaA [Cr